MSLMQLCRGAMRRRRLRDAARDPVGVAARRALAPVQRERAQIARAMGQLEKDSAALEAQLADCVRRLEAASGHERRQKSEQERLLDLASRLSGERKALEAQRDAKGKEYLGRAAEVGLEGAESRLQQVRDNPRQVRDSHGSMLQEFARLDFQVREKEDGINDARAGAARAGQAASEHRLAAAAEADRRAAIRLRLDGACRGIEDCLARKESAERRRALVEADAAALRRAVPWAEGLSPLVRPSVANLPILLELRRQAIRTAVAVKDFEQLRGMACAASELEAFPGIHSELREQGFTPADLRAMGFPLAQVAGAGYQARQLLLAEFTPAELREVGFSARDLGDAGVTAQDLLDTGFPVAALREAGFEAGLLVKLGVPALELRRGGFTLQEMLGASLTASQLRSAGFSAGQLLEHGLSILQAAGAGFTYGELVQEGCDPIYARAAHEYVAGSSIDDLIHDRGIPLHQLKAAGFTAAHLFPACSSPTAWFRFQVL